MKPLFDLLIMLLRILVPFCNRTTRERIGSILVVVSAIAAAVATYAPEIMAIIDPPPAVEQAAPPAPAEPLTPADVVPPDVGAALEVFEGVD